MATAKSLVWRRSSFSGGGDTGGGNCVEAALLPAGRAAVRDSKSPDAAVVLPRVGLSALVRHVAG